MTYSPTPAPDAGSLCCLFPLRVRVHKKHRPNHYAGSGRCFLPLWSKDRTVLEIHWGWTIIRFAAERCPCLRCDSACAELFLRDLPALRHLPLYVGTHNWHDAFPTHKIHINSPFCTFLFSAAHKISAKFYIDFVLTDIYITHSPLTFNYFLCKFYKKRSFFVKFSNLLLYIFVCE